MNYPLTTYGWVLVIAFWGALANMIRRKKAGLLPRFSLAEFLGDMVIAGFIGVITFWICEASHVPQVLTAAAVGISGHLGTRGIMLLENVFIDKIGLEKMKNKDNKNEK